MGMTGVPLNINLQQIMLHLFNFTILFAILYILLYKPVKDFMAKREAYYADMDSKAKDELAKAEKHQEELDDKLRGFEDEVKSEKVKARRELEEMRDKQLAEAKAEAEKIVSDARLAADREKAAIVESAKKEITDYVADAVEKLAKSQTASDAFDEFLDSAEG